MVKRGSYLLCAVLLTGASALADQPALHQNSEKYKDAGMHAATGRSGNASIVARALLGKDTVTDLQVTTGQLDTDAAAPGNIDKVQLKLYGGGSTYTKNYNGLSAGGNFALRVQGLARHESFQIQSNVSGIDAKRTDVITVDEQVELRPDLAASNLQMPRRAKMKVPVNISAVISERNGDVGARADCVLSVDGKQADQAIGIWVDAASSVSCAFTHPFDTTGTHQVAVSATRVVPGDYDDANNGVQGTIEILNPETPFDWYDASAEDKTFNYDNHFTSPWQTYNWSGSGWAQGSWFFGWAGPIQYDNAHVTVSEITNGQIVSHADTALTQGWHGSTYNASYGCGWGFDSASYRWVSSCASYWSDGTNTYGGSWVNTWRGAGAVTYHSDGWNCYYWNCAYGYVYTWNYTLHDVYGTRAQFGPTDVTDVTITNGTNTYSAHAVVKLQPFDYISNYSYCYDWWYWYWYGGYGQVCYDIHEHRQGVRGYTNKMIDDAANTQ